MKKPTFREKFKYWFDNHMSKGSIGLIQFLVIASLFVVITITCLILLLKWDDESGFWVVFWDNLATIINAWVPYSDDGNVGYVLLSSVAAIIGVLFTSILIGIFSSAIEEKVESLKNGNSKVLENDHFLVLGFNAGEYSLLQQLVLAAGNDPRCIVVAGETERSEMESSIRDNIVLPKNVRIICRSIDICDAVQLQCCSPETSQAIIIVPQRDDLVVRSILAVASFTEEKKQPIIAEIRSADSLLPKSYMVDHHVIMIRTGEILSRIIARASAHPGLSGAYMQFFDFTGSEIYIDSYPEMVGKSIYDINTLINNGVVIGLYRDNKPVLNPDRLTEITADDKLIVFEERANAAKFGTFDYGELHQDEDAFVLHRSQETIAFIGYNSLFSEIITELPTNIHRILLLNGTDEEKALAEASAADREVQISCVDCSISDETKMGELLKKVQHVVLLSEFDEDMDPDYNVMFRILHLRSIRKKQKLSFTITAEMRHDSNRSLVSDEKTDFIVSTNLSAMFLAQLAENPEIERAFREILSNEGNEIYFKRPSKFNCAGENSVVRLRRTLSKSGYVFLGYVKNNNSSDREYFFNPPYDEIIQLDDKDRLIVLGEQ